MLCRGAALKVSPYIIHSADYIFLWSFEIREGILRNQKIIIGKDSFSNQRFNTFGPIWIILVFVSTTLLKLQNYSNFLWLHAAKSIGLLKRLD